VLRLGKSEGLDANALASFHGLSDSSSAERPPDYMTKKVFVPERQSALHRAAAWSKVCVCARFFSCKCLCRLIYVSVILMLSAGIIGSCEAAGVLRPDPLSSLHYPCIPLASWECTLCPSFESMQVEVIEKLLQWEGLDVNVKDEVGWCVCAYVCVCVCVYVCVCLPAREKCIDQ
jgi:hypothetical protein